MPASSVVRTQLSIASAAAGWPSDQRSIIAADRIVALGLAVSVPARCGDDPWIGSKRPATPWTVRRSPSDAEGSMPSDPASTEASSERMSPNMFSVTMTSNDAGFVMSDIARSRRGDARA